MILGGLGEPFPRICRQVQCFRRCGRADSGKTTPELPQAFALPWPFENTAPVDKSEKTALQDHPRPPKTTEITDITEIARKHCTCRQIQENGSPRSLLGVRKHCTCRQIREKTFENTAPVDKSEKTALRGHWALKSVAAEPLGARIGCSGATGRSKSLLSSVRHHYHLCSVLTWCSNRLLRSHWALEKAALSLLRRH